MKTSILSLVLAATLAVTPLLPRPEPDLHFARGGVYVDEETTVRNGVSLSHRTYEIYNGDCVEIGRAAASADPGAWTAAQVDLPAGGTVRWYDPAANSWQAAPLGKQTIRASCVVITLDGGGEALIYTPKVYDNLGRGTLRHRPALDGSLRLRQNGDGWSASLIVPSLPAGCVADYTLVVSPERLFAAPKVLDNFWRVYTLDGDGKWCYDGFYFPSPSSYVPSGANCYYRLPAAYLCSSFVGGAIGKSSVRASEDLAIMTLDVMFRQQNQYGYLPTLPRSEWLYGDYGIDGGFYDTRFNTDFIETYMRFARWSRCEELDAALGRYFDFYLSFAAAHHQETANGGWLVDDYWNPAGGAATHTSLNHQLSELLALYHGADHLDRSDLRELADRMLLAVEDTAGKWIRADSNLHYAAYRNGTYGGVDYPYLTYNDLYNLKAYLGRGTPGIDRLMSAKKTWMDANGVTEYRK